MFKFVFLFVLCSLSVCLVSCVGCMCVLLVCVLVVVVMCVRPSRVVVRIRLDRGVFLFSRDKQARQTSE